MQKNLDELFGEFVKEKRACSGLSETTLRGYEATFKLFRTLMPAIDVDTLQKSAIVNFFDILKTRPREVGKYKELRTGVRKSTVATYRSKLISFCDWLVNGGYIKINPVKQTKGPYVKYEDRRWLNSDEVSRIFSTLVLDKNWVNLFVKKRNIAMFVILLCCGLRKSELIYLRIFDIDLKRKMLTVNGVTSKSKMDRVVPINSQVYNALVDYLDERAKLQPDTEYLFLSDGGKRGFSEAGLKHLIQKVSDISGVKFHAHRFRHTFAVNLLRSGVQLANLQQLMGHRSFKMTCSYLRCLPSSMLMADLENLRVDNLV